MSFPREHDIRRDLEGLWAAVRNLQRAKQLGHSSLGPTDGAMEIHNAAGNPVAKVGHEGSLGGLLVRNSENTAWVSLADERTRIDGRVNSAWNSIDSHHDRISTAEGNITTLQGTASNHATRIGSLEGAVGGIGSLEGRIASLETGMGVVMGALQNLHNRVSALEGGSGGPPPWA